MRRWVIGYMILGLALLCVLALLPPTPQQHSTAPLAHHTHPARMDVVQGIRIVHLYGDASAMGEQHGRLLQQDIHFLIEHYLNKFLNQQEREIGLHAAHNFFEPHIPESYRNEMRALAKACNIDYDTVLLAQCFLDIGRVLACSTAAIPSHSNALGEPMLLRNLDFPSLGLAEKHSYIFVRHYPDGRSLVSVGWPLLLGTLSGFNSDGLAVAMLESHSKPSAVKGMPYALRYRHALETCSNSAALRDYFNGVAITASNNLISIDRSDDACVFELTPQIIEHRYKPGAMQFATNHFRSKTLNDGNTCLRYNYLQEYFSPTSYQQNLDLHSAEAVLHRVALKSINLQSFVILPDSQRLHISLGKLPASAGPFVTLDKTALGLTSAGD